MDLATPLFAIGTVGFALVLGANIFEQVVCVPGWRTEAGLRAWRELIRVRHPGYFFLTVAPISLVCLLAGTILGWDNLARRPYALAATITLCVMLAFTRAFFIPLNLRLFLRPQAQTWAETSRLVERWVRVNHVRVAFTAGAVVLAVMGLRR
jgi:uncharacterized membrane protein